MAMKMDRRSFLKTSAAVAVAVSMTGLLGGCSGGDGGTDLGGFTVAVGDTVAMVTVEGVECSEDTVKDGSYKIQRPFVFVTNKSVALSEQAQAFVDFATSKDAADLIRTAGAVPVNE